MTSNDIAIRAATRSDAEAIWQTLEPTIRAGETLALERDLSRDVALSHWFSWDNEVFVAEQEGTIVGTYFLRTNQPGGGTHVATAIYVVSPSATGRGIAQAMCEHSLETARARGYLAMQFDFVVSNYSAGLSATVESVDLSDKATLFQSADQDGTLGTALYILHGEFVLEIFTNSELGDSRQLAINLGDSLVSRIP